MTEEPGPAPTPAGRRAFLWVGSVMVVVIVATITAFLIVVFAGGDDPDSEVNEPGSTPTTGSTSINPGADTATPTAAPTFSPDLPDLVIDAVFSRDNQLTVVVANVGVADAVATVLISVDGAQPVAADIKPGEPIRPDDRLQIALDSEYVQRRATVSVTVSTDPSIDEESLDNNTLETVVTPDRPNDLAIDSVTIEGPDSSLRVTIRNNSPIPITGNATISAREATTPFTQFGTRQPTFTLAPDETLDVVFPDAADVDLANIEVLMTTTAIDDADRTNDVYPR